MSSSRKKSSCRSGSRFSARAKRDLRPYPPTSGSHGRGPSLPPWFGPQPTGRRKVARPFVPHGLLEARLSAVRARGAWRLDRPANRAAIRRILVTEAARTGVDLRKASFAPTVLRMELSARRRADLSSFFRAVAGRVPRAVTGAERGRPLVARKASANRKFWDGLVASRAL